MDMREREEEESRERPEPALPTRECLLPLLPTRGLPFCSMGCVAVMDEAPKRSRLLVCLQLKLTASLAQQQKLSSFAAQASSEQWYIVCRAQNLSRWGRPSQSAHWVAQQSPFKLPQSTFAAWPLN